MESTVTWNSGLAFTALQGGHSIALDAPVASGGKDSGASPKALLLSGLGGCTGIDVVSGKRKWFTELAKGSAITGPPVIAGGSIHIPMSDGRVVVLAPDSGKPVEPKFKQPNFRLIWSGEISRKILEEALMQRSLGTATK